MKKSPAVISDNLAVPEIRLENEVEDQEEDSEKDGNGTFCISYDNAVPEIRTGRADSPKEESQQKSSAQKNVDKKSQE